MKTSLKARPTKIKGHSRKETPYSKHKAADKMRSKSLSDVTQVVAELEQLLSKAAKPDEAKSMKQYMRNKFDFYGIKTPQRREIFRQVFSHKAQPSAEWVLSVAKLLWSKDQRELQYCATDLLTKHKPVLATEADVCSQSVVATKDFITQKSWWDTVDALASNVIGHMTTAQTNQMRRVLDEWIQSDNMWLRRTAILHQLKYKEKTDERVLFRYCLQCCRDEEFFIQKAIGWVLREHHKTNPDSVKEFVRKNTHKLAKLSVREALKHHSTE